MTGATFMSDGTLGASGYTQTPYKLVTSDIENISSGVSGSGDGLEALDPAYYNWENVWSATDDFQDTNELYTVWGVTSNAGSTYTFNPPLPVNNSFRFHSLRYFIGSDRTSHVTVTGPGGSVNNKGNTLENQWKEGLASEVGGFINSITVKTDQSQGVNSFNALEVDGVRISDLSTTLTFADPNPDLRYFEAGDVVQQTGDDSQTWSALPLGGTTTPTLFVPNCQCLQRHYNTNGRW